MEDERIRKREEQLRKEREDEEFCASRHKGDRSQAQLRFMYDAPPGMQKESKNGENRDTDKRFVYNLLLLHATSKKKNFKATVVKA